MTVTEQISVRMRSWLAQSGAPFGGPDKSNARIAGLIREAARDAAADLEAYLALDPASTDASLVAGTHAGFKTVAAYRLAHRLRNDGAAVELRQAAHQLSELAKARWGAEIHPAAHIGPRFVLDHGANTVIGETAEIGEDCTILNNVTLGAQSIAGNPDGPRHPILGDRVQVGAAARIYGRVTVGNDAFIGPGCIITASVPARSRAVRHAEVQLHLVEGRTPTVFGIVPGRVGHLHIFGDTMDACRVRIVCTETLEPVDFAECVQLEGPSANRLTVLIALRPGMPVHDQVGIEIALEDGARCVICQAPGLRVALRDLAGHQALESTFKIPEIQP